MEIVDLASVFAVHPIRIRRVYRELSRTDDTVGGVSNNESPP